jgi:ssRNA-specific RNase YbeY (16S rRNA maturation enzyme)
MAKSETSSDMKAKEAAMLAEARAESKTDQNVAAIKAKEQAERAVADGVKPEIANAGARVVKVMVKILPNSGYLTLNNVQLRIAKATDVMSVPYAFYAAFPNHFALIDDK